MYKRKNKKRTYSVVAVVLLIYLSLNTLIESVLPRVRYVPKKRFKQSLYSIIGMEQVVDLNHQEFLRNFDIRLNQSFYSQNQNKEKRMSQENINSKERVHIRFKDSDYIDKMNKQFKLSTLSHTSIHNSKLIQLMTDKYNSYLKPANVAFQQISASLEPPASRKVAEDIFRTGYGLQPHLTESGDRGWIENGIVFQPVIREQRIPGEGVSDRDTRYEAHVPFNRDLFFEGIKHNTSVYKLQKKVIVWHTPSRFTPLTNDLEPLEKCPDFPCRLSTNVDLYYKKSAAVIFAGKL